MLEHPVPPMTDVKWERHANQPRHRLIGLTCGIDMI